MNQQLHYDLKVLASGDIDLMRALLDMFGDAFDETDTYCDNQPDDDYLKSLLGKDHFIALVAVQSNKVIAGLTAYELQKFEQQRSEIYVYDLAVDESFRRQGVATAMLTELKAVARDRGAYLIFIQADYGDEPAIALYESLGKKEQVLHFDIKPD